MNQEDTDGEELPDENENMEATNGDQILSGMNHPDDEASRTALLGGNQENTAIDEKKPKNIKEKVTQGNLNRIYFSRD